VLWGLTLGSAMVLVGCSAAVKQSGAPATSTVPPVVVTASPVAGATAVPLDQKIQVAVANGTLKTVSLASPSGTVKGVVAPGATSWESALPLQPTTTYQLEAALVDGVGRVSTKHWQFTTAAPATLFRATLYPASGVVGVGMPMTVTLNTPVPVAKQAAFESLLTVTTTPAVAGAWHWFSPTSLHWRPAQYWAPGTKVHVEAHIDGYDAGGGVWGAKDVTVDYAIGDSHVSTVDANAHTMTVTDNGAVVKTIPVSTGRDKYPTKSGIHVVSDKTPKTIMDSATVGIPRNSPDGYYETVFWDVRISNSGEFVHAAPWSVSDQGHVNVSHGCVNVSTADAEWFYNYSQVGDVVNVVGTDDTLEPTNGYGDWQIPWASWAN
jgi:lipoprotein-anchoring transpeptidase ErfK/SrfK